MKQVLLDTNFIMSCARQKIDFLEQIPLMGMEMLIPKQVLDELESLSKSKESAFIREDADLALKLLNRNKFTLMKLRRNNVDRGIIELAEENKDLIIATLDKELKGKISNQKLIIKGRKKLEII
ncbi:MAG: PIN domain-containing protein [Candidatus Nanoarchaeia archaeon]|nr:PIN domain-containing protein [Candidatus Nanoarchaeia archaeon]